VGERSDRILSCRGKRKIRRGDRGCQNSAIKGGEGENSKKTTAKKRERLSKEGKRYAQESTYTSKWRCTKSHPHKRLWNQLKNRWTIESGGGGGGGGGRRSGKKKKKGGKSEGGRRGGGIIAPIQLGASAPASPETQKKSQATSTSPLAEWLLRVILKGN